MTATSPPTGRRPATVGRRRLLQGGLAAGAVAGLGVPTLAGCSNEGRGGGGSQAANDAVKLPDYIPHQGIRPDLVGENGVSDGMLAYPADPVEVSDGRPGDGKPVSAFALTNTPAPPGVEKNEFWQELNKRLGFEFSVSLVPTSDFEERFQTAVAGDQLPDLFTFFPGGAPSLPALLGERAVDLTPLLSGSAVSKYPFLANIPTDSWRETVYGGKIYGVPVPRGAQSSVVLYARQDVLAERGLDQAPTSWQDYYDLFAELTPSAGNSWALSAVPMLTLRVMFGVPNGWSMQDGNLVSALEDERQQEALEAGRKLWADKLVHPDTFTSSIPQRKTWVANGTCLFLEGTFSGWSDFYNFPIPAEFELTAYPPPKADGGGRAPIWLADPTHNVTAVGLQAEDRAEAMLSFLNHLAAPFGSAEYLFQNYGIEGVHYKLQDTDPVLTEKGRSETQLSLDYLAAGPWTNYQAGRPEVTQAQFDAQNAMVPDAIPNPTQGLYSETESRKGGQLGQAIGNLESDILQGRRPVSAWADGVARWKRDGGDTIRDELRAALDERSGG